MNNYTLDEKLDVAIQSKLLSDMGAVRPPSHLLSDFVSNKCAFHSFLCETVTEALAELHGFPLGAMTNDDIALDQSLMSADGRVILNDFNNVVAPDWNSDAQEHCQCYTSFGGTFKAPEEYDGACVDTWVDLWPAGNIIFTLLTGLKPHHNETDEEKIQELTRQGPPYIDPRHRNRSLVERRMVEIMDRCHVLEPKDRVDIFEVIHHLRETKQMHLQEKVQSTLSNMMNQINHQQDTQQTCKCSLILQVQFVHSLNSTELYHSRKHTPHCRRAGGKEPLFSSRVCL